jgi:hypothetical protein
MVDGVEGRFRGSRVHGSRLQRCEGEDEGEDLKGRKPET